MREENSAQIDKEGTGTEQPTRPKWLTEALVLGYLSVVGYAMAYSYSYAYAAHFGIPSMFVQPRATDLYEVLVFNILGVFFLTILAQFASILVLKLCIPDKFRRKLAKAFGTWGILLFSAFLASLGWLWFLGQLSVFHIVLYGVMFTVSAVLALRMLKSGKAPLWLKRILTEDEQHQKAASSINWDVPFGSLLAAFIFLLAAYQLGAVRASSQEYFLSWTRENDRLYIVLYRSGDQIISAPLSQANPNMPEFSILTLGDPKLEDLRGINVKRENEREPPPIIQLRRYLDRNAAKLTGQQQQDETTRMAIPLPDAK